MSSSESEDSKGGHTASGRSVTILTGSSDYAKWARSITAYLMSRNLLGALKNAPLLPRASISGGPMPATTASTMLSSSKEVTFHSSDVEDSSSTRTNASAALSAVSAAAAGKTSRVNSRKNEKAWSYIYLHLSDTVQNNLSPESADPMEPDACRLWVELRRVYGVSSLQELAVRMEVIWGTSIPENENPDRYFARMRSAYNDVIGNKTPFADNLFAIAMLRSLPPSFSVLGQTLVQRSTLTSEEVITCVRTEWMRQESANPVSAALFASAPSAPRSGLPPRRNNTNNNRDPRPQSDREAHNGNGNPAQWSCPIHRTNGHELQDCRTVLNRMNRLASNNRANVANARTSPDDIPATAYIASALFALNAPNEFHLDSGASQHLIFDRTMLKKATPFVVPITIGDGRTLLSTHKGDFKIANNMDLRNVLVVPELSCNLISIQKLAQLGHSIHFSSTSCTVGDPVSDTKLVAPFQNGLYTFQASLSVDTALVVQSADPLSSWHRKLGHLNFRDTFELGKAELLGKGWNGVTYKDVEKAFCEPCILGKGKRQSSSATDLRAVQPNQIVHSDLWGPSRTRSVAGARYMLTCYDDFTRRLQAFFLKKKSHAYAAFKSYIALVNNQCNTTVKTVRTDRGGEFTSHKFLELLSVNGIQASKPPADAHAQNGRVERSHLTIFNLVRTLLIDSGFPQSFWAEAAAYACQVRNRTPNKATGKCPQELWSGRQSQSYDNIHAFGAQIYVRDHRQTDKLKPRYFAARFLGWESDSNSVIRYYDPRTKSTGFSRDVVYRNPVPEANTSSPDPVDTSPKPPTMIPVPVEVFDVGEESDDSDTESVAEEFSNDTPNPPHTDRDTSPDVRSSPMVNSVNDQPVYEAESIPDVVPATPQQQPSSVPQSTRTASPSVPPSRIPILNRKPKETRHQTSKLVRIGDVDDVASRDISRILGQPSHIDENGRRIQPVRKSRRSALITHAVLPQSYKQAQDSPEWEHWWKAILDELAKMEQYAVWKLVPRSSAHHILQARWVFTRKIDGESGLPCAYKARWVAKGYRQIEGLDYNETFASVVHKDTVRIFLALVNFLDLDCDQVDITAAFLNGELKEIIFLEPPEGLDVPSDQVLLLKKSLYGLKQSPRCFNDALDKWLRSEKFQPSTADPCLYIYQEGDVFMALIVHVEDQLIASNNRQRLDQFKKRLNDRFECKDSGPVNYFLGFNVSRSRESRTLTISQRHYLEGVLARFGMSDSHPARTPFPVGFQAKPATNQEYDAAKHLDYPQLAGSILYAATISRPDLSFPAGILTRYISKWSREHYNAAKHLLRYIRGSIDVALTFRGDGKVPEVVGYADADWGGCLETRRSTTGYVFRTFGGVTCWRSRRQPTVALSTTEAELMSCTEAIKQALWLKQLYSDLGFNLDTPITIFNDNNGTIALSQNPVDHDRSKHMGIRTHFCRDSVKDGLANLARISTHDNPADIFTKSLPSVKHNLFSEMIGMVRMENRT